MLHVPQDMMELLPQHKFSVRLVGIGQQLQDAPLKVNYDSVRLCKTIYYMPIYDTSFELSFPGYLIPKHYFFDSISLSFKARLTLVTCFTATLRKLYFKDGIRDRKNNDLTSGNVT